MGLGGLKEQKAFEKSIWEKVKRGGGESPAIIQTLSPHVTHLSLSFVILRLGLGLALIIRRDPPSSPTYHLNAHYDGFNIHNRRPPFNFE